MFYFGPPDRDNTSAYPFVTPKLPTSRSAARVIHQQSSSAIPGDCTQKPSSYIRNVSLCKWMKTLLQLSAVSGGGKRGLGYRHKDMPFMKRRGVLKRKLGPSVYSDEAYVSVVWKLECNTF